MYDNDSIETGEQYYDYENDRAIVPKLVLGREVYAETRDGERVRYDRPDFDDAVDEGTVERVRNGAAEDVTGAQIIEALAGGN